MKTLLRLLIINPSTNINTASLAVFDTMINKSSDLQPMTFVILLTTPSEKDRITDRCTLDQPVL